VPEKGSGQPASSEIFGDGQPFGDPSWYQRWHTPYYNESHERLRAEVREWVTSEIEPNCFEWVFTNVTFVTKLSGREEGRAPGNLQTDG
jgi:hypothetical protein